MQIVAYLCDCCSRSVVTCSRALSWHQKLWIMWNKLPRISSAIICGIRMICAFHLFVAIMFMYVFCFCCFFFCESIKCEHILTYSLERMLISGSFSHFIVNQLICLHAEYGFCMQFIPTTTTPTTKNHPKNTHRRRRQQQTATVCKTLMRIRHIFKATTTKHHCKFVVAVKNPNPGVDKEPTISYDAL